MSPMMLPGFLQEPHSVAKACDSESSAALSSVAKRDDAEAAVANARQDALRTAGVPYHPDSHCLARSEVLVLALAQTPLSLLESLGENARYILAALAWLVVGGFARWYTRFSMRKAERADRNRAGRAAFVSSGLLAALVALLLGGGGLGLGGGEGDFSGEASSLSAKDPASSTTESQPASPSKPSQKKIVVSIKRDAKSGKINYLLGDTPVEPGKFEEAFRAFCQKNPALKEAELRYPAKAAAADVLAIQRVISSHPEIAFSTRPSE